MTAPAPRPAYERLEPALLLACDRVGRDPARGGGFYRVTGGSEPHFVDLTAGARICDCGDAAYRTDRLCKHLVACLLREGDPGAVAALGDYADNLAPLCCALDERPISWIRVDPAIDVTLFRFTSKLVIVGGLAGQGFLYARWHPSGFWAARGLGTIEGLPSRVLELLLILYPELAP